METPQTIGKYEVIAQVASGGFGIIFKGWDPFIKRQVAIKMCATQDEEVRKRFHQEAQFVADLKEGILRCHAPAPDAHDVLIGLLEET